MNVVRRGGWNSRRDVLVRHFYLLNWQALYERELVQTGKLDGVPVEDHFPCEAGSRSFTGRILRLANLTEQQFELTSSAAARIKLRPYYYSLLLHDVHSIACHHGARSFALPV